MNKPIREGFVATDEAAPAPAAPAPPVEQEDVETWPIKVKLLHRPIRNHKNEEVRELSFREPTGADINRYGNPCRIRDSVEFEVLIDERKMTAMMSSLAGILTPEIERLDPRDWNSCAYRLRRFFLPEPAAWG